MKFGDYQLREAAGRYWLLDMRQKGLKFKKPLCLNESGAYFWELIRQGKTKEQIICHLCDEFHLQQNEAKEDLEAFIEQLEEYNIIL